MLRLPHKSLSVFCGVVPSSLEHLRFAYEKTVFNQVVTLNSKNLVQLCNFMRRMRKERATRSPKKYLVLLNFFPQRDTWHFLDVMQDFNISVVLVGHLCAANCIEELVNCSGYLLEWFEKAEAEGRPVICARELQSVSCGVLNIFERDHGFEEHLKRWTNHINRKKFKSVSSSSGSSHEKQQKQKEKGQAKNKKSFIGNEFMNLQKACQILEIAEQQCQDAELIRKRWKLKAAKCHPDKILDEQHKKMAEEMFKAIGEAKRFLLGE